MDLDHWDFRFGRAWLCFVEDNGQKFLNAFDEYTGEGTNHVSLKFDFKVPKQRTEDIIWYGIQLEATLPNPKQLAKDRRLRPSKVRLTLKPYPGPSRKCKFSIEMETDFDVVAGGTTLGRLIHLLWGTKLLRIKFYYSKLLLDRNLVGCRDWLAQVLHELQAENRITGRLKYRETVLVQESEGQYKSWDTKLLFRDDIYVALACYFTPHRIGNKDYPVAKSSKTELGHLDEERAKLKRGGKDPQGGKRQRLDSLRLGRKTYPYSVDYEFGFVRKDPDAMDFGEVYSEEGGIEKSGSEEGGIEGGGIEEGSIEEGGIEEGGIEESGSEEDDSEEDDSEDDDNEAALSQQNLYQQGGRSVQPGAQFQLGGGALYPQATYSAQQPQPQAGYGDQQAHIDYNSLQQSQPQAGYVDQQPVYFNQPTGYYNPPAVYPDQQASVIYGHPGDPTQQG
ncbi:hypothetical protein Daus18300_009561 [Diaporthe australafricana]|uniref:Arrestin-like N-terminal domain-containing protein n=1 Tax=Diaporthe australafricana TaxID=127596 RepID=A0ABR3WE12_9PEZI